jgi:hypothetical protein
MDQSCTNSDFFVDQAKIIKKAIDEDKWFLSEREHRDVGWEKAEHHFIQTYFAGFTAGFRISYCSLICPNRYNCNEAEKWLKDLN